MHHECKRKDVESKSSFSLGRTAALSNFVTSLVALLSKMKMECAEIKRII